MPKRDVTAAKAAAAPVIEPKRGRPTADRSAAIDSAIREVATQSFLSAGYEGTTMEAVAEGARVPKSTLYKRFPDKRTLLRAVLDDRLDAWCVDDGYQIKGRDLETRLKRLITDILSRAISPEVQTFWGLACEAWAGPDEIGVRQEAIGYTKIVERLALEIREYGPQCGLEARQPKQVATAIMVMLAGWIEYVGPASRHPAAEAARFAEFAVDLVLRGSDAW